MINILPECSKWVSLSYFKSLIYRQWSHTYVIFHTAPLGVHILALNYNTICVALAVQLLHVYCGSIIVKWLNIYISVNKHTTVIHVLSCKSLIYMDKTTMQNSQYYCYGSHSRRTKFYVEKIGSDMLAFLQWLLILIVFFHCTQYESEPKKLVHRACML